jgi:hypothetical protein
VTISQISAPPKGALLRYVVGDTLLFVLVEDIKKQTVHIFDVRGSIDFQKAARLWTSQSPTSERERSVAVAGTLSFTIKMADQEDIVLRRRQGVSVIRRSRARSLGTRLLRVATWIVELT